MDDTRKPDEMAEMMMIAAALASTPRVSRKRNVASQKLRNKSQRGQARKSKNKAARASRLRNR